MNMSTPASSDVHPPLWNPNAAACWSLVFTPAFGAYLHAQNAEALGRFEEAKANRLWFKTSLAYLAIVCVSAFVPFIPEIAFQGAGFGVLFGWYFSIGKKQVDYAKNTLRGSYPRRPWTKPLLAGLGCFVAFLAVASAIGYVAVLLGFTE
jgi:hypothetical protein